MGRAVNINLWCRQGEDLFHTMTFAYKDVEANNTLKENNYDNHDFTLVAEQVRGGDDVAVASTSDGTITTGQSWTTMLPGESELREFTHAIVIHVPNAITSTISPGEYPITLIRTEPESGYVDKSVLGTLTVEAGGQKDA